ncbi:hypothetical protein AAG906_019622 [Vitis piasezkii]
MPMSASTHRPEDRLTRLRFANADADADAKLKALREVKNKIIDNRTKKLSYIKLGAVAVVSVLAATPEDCSSILVQSAAALDSFAYSSKLAFRRCSAPAFFLACGAFSPILMEMLWMLVFVPLE